MRLLIITQVVDRDDLVLGFFHEWIAALAPRFSAIEVICLKEGKHALPENVRVHSLGKEHGTQSRFVYAWRFLKLAWRLRSGYDAVFVHMNEEYLLVAGWFWKLSRKPMYLWKNHHQGSILTDIAAAYCRHVFCTSRYSYTARYGKTIIMPVGVDTDLFKPDASAARVPRSILSFGRIAPTKNLHVFLSALTMLAKEGVDFTAALYGDALPDDAPYLMQLKSLVKAAALADRITFHPGVPKADAPAVYSCYQLFVNAAKSGMFDKTLFEAAACGCDVIAASRDFEQLAGESHAFTEGSAASLAERIRERLAAPMPDFSSIVGKESLPVLVQALAGAMGAPASGVLP